MADVLPYSQPRPPRRHPLRVASGVLAVVLGATALGLVTASLYFHFMRHDWILSEVLASTGAVTALVGVVASVWNLPRLLSVLGLGLSLLALAGLGVISLP